MGNFGAYGSCKLCFPDLCVPTTCSFASSTLKIGGGVFNCLAEGKKNQFLTKKLPFLADFGRQMVFNCLSEAKNANRSQVAQDTAHPAQHAERAHWLTGAKWPRTPHKQNDAPSGHTGEQEPSGPGHRTSKTTHQAGTPVNRSQVAQDTAHATQHAEPAHGCIGAKWPRTLHKQNNTLSRHTGEPLPCGPGHRTHNTTRRAGTPVNRSQVAQDTAHPTKHAERAHC